MVRALHVLALLHVPVCARMSLDRVLQNAKRPALMLA